MRKLVVSDLHLGSGTTAGELNPFEDFHFDRQFEEFLDFHCQGRAGSRPLELVLNGDILDFLKVEIDGQFPDHIDRDLAVAKGRRIIAGHPRFFAALRRFLKGKDRKITYIMGNHDLEVAFPEVQDLLASALDPRDGASSQAPGEASGDGANLEFRIYSPHYDLPGGVRVIHGNQFDPLNRVNLRTLFVKDDDGKEILNLPWGSVFLLKVLLPFKERRPYINLVYPFGRYLALAWLTDTAFAAPMTFKGIYYFAKTRFWEARRRGGDLARTLGALRDELTPYHDQSQEALGILEANPALQAVIMGHSHGAMLRKGPGGRLYLNTGTWTKLISLHMPELGSRTLLTFARVDYPARQPHPTVSLFSWRGQRPVEEEISY